MLQLPEPPYRSFTPPTLPHPRTSAHAETPARNTLPTPSAPLPSLYSKGYWDCPGYWESREIRGRKDGVRSRCPGVQRSAPWRDDGRKQKPCGPSARPSSAGLNGGARSCWDHPLPVSTPPHHLSATGLQPARWTLQALSLPQVWHPQPSPLRTLSPGAYGAQGRAFFQSAPFAAMPPALGIGPSIH